MFRRALALGSAAALLSGCVNHVRYSSDAFEHSVRDVVNSETVVDAHAPVLVAPRLDLELAADETAIVRRMRTVVRNDEYTPYRSGPETWEVPVGLLCLPAMLFANAGHAVGLDLAQPRSLGRFTSWTLVAVNPLMNLGAEGRMRREEVSRESEELDHEVRRELRPLAGVRLALALDPRAPRRFVADARGRVSVELLALAPPELSGGPRVLRVSVDGEETREPHVVELPISRALAGRIERGARLRAAARAPGASPEAVGRALATLATLGFSDSAVALETELRTRAADDRGWLARLDSALRP